MNTKRSLVRRSLPSAAIGFALVVAACATPTPSPGTTATPAPTVRPSPTEVGNLARADCTPADIELAHGRIDGAAGSRFTTLTLTVTGSAACILPGGPTVELVDAGGAILFTSVAAGASSIDLSPGATATSTIQLANWCTDPPAQPVTLTLVLGSATIDAAGGPFPSANEMPPCNGGPALVFSPSHWALP